MFDTGHRSYSHWRHRQHLSVHHVPSIHGARLFFGSYPLSEGTLVSENSIQRNFLHTNPSGVSLLRLVAGKRNRNDRTSHRFLWSSPCRSPFGLVRGRWEVGEEGDFHGSPSPDLDMIDHIFSFSLKSSSKSRIPRYFSSAVTSVTKLPTTHLGEAVSVRWTWSLSYPKIPLAGAFSVPLRCFASGHQSEANSAHAHLVDNRAPPQSLHDNLNKTRQIGSTVSTGSRLEFSWCLLHEAIVCTLSLMVHTATRVCAAPWGVGSP